jgi:hypothetical protein
MTKRIVLLFFVFAAMILPAAAATKARAHKNSVVRSSKSKSIRKSARSHKSVSGKRRSSSRQKAAKR